MPFFDIHQSDAITAIDDFSLNVGLPLVHVLNEDLKSIVERKEFLKVYNMPITKKEDGENASITLTAPVVGTRDDVDASQINLDATPFCGCVSAERTDIGIWCPLACFSHAQPERILKMASDLKNGFCVKKYFGQLSAASMATKLCLMISDYTIGLLLVLLLSPSIISAN